MQINLLFSVLGFVSDLWGDRGGSRGRGESENDLCLLPRSFVQNYAIGSDTAPPTLHMLAANKCTWMHPWHTVIRLGLRGVST